MKRLLIRDCLKERRTMKRLLAALLFIALAVQAASLSAFAEVGKVLSHEELARAYALTGLGDREGVYHNGMKPNAAWNAMQLSDWLSDRLDNNLYSIDEILSRANYTLDQLREDNPTPGRSSSTAACTPALKPSPCKPRLCARNCGTTSSTSQSARG